VSEETSMFRLYLMRLLYALNFVMLGLSVWPEIINHAGAWDPVKGVAFSFWAALSVLSGLGLRYPLKMLPLLLLQLLYKSIWVIAVALPLWSAFRSIELTKIMAMGAVVDLIVIPWPYVIDNYVKKPGDRWR
jgi:hypothetical protein